MLNSMEDMKDDEKAILKVSYRGCFVRGRVYMERSGG